jgi:hypothetical protein
MRWIFSLFLLVSSIQSFAQKSSFTDEVRANAPDYKDESAWSALPFRKDAADIVPKDEEWVSDSVKKVDVFYVHPTMYQRGPLWNASLEMGRINRKVDNYPVRLQASVFNKTCRVYAPRYRQAVVKVFYEPSADGDSALNLAYQDVKRAFQHFLDHYSNGRPFIIAGHSQGTHHTRRLLSEIIDTTELRDRMVAAYVIGFGVNDSKYQNLSICQSAKETGCYVSWMSYKTGYRPTGEWFQKTQSVNPLSWNVDDRLIRVDEYAGTVVMNPKRKFTRPMSVQIADVGGSVLWVTTKAPWFRGWKNLHVADYGLFYHSIRENVEKRVSAFLSKEPSKQ